MKRIIFTLLVIISASLCKAQPGTLDYDFSADGLFTFEYNTRNTEASCILALPDGKILVAGSTMHETAYEDYFIIRLTPDGNLDNTFSSDGIDTVDFNGYFDRPTSIQLLQDGSILLGGLSYNNLMVQYLTATRFTAEGVLDTSFANKGKLIWQYQGGNTFINDMILDANGKMIFAGSYNLDNLLVRFNADGSLDSTFGTEGVAISDFGAWENITAIALQKDGKIVMGGTSGTTPTKYNFSVARYNIDGSLDNTFSYDGYAVTALGPNHDRCNDMILASDGKILVMGISSVNPINSFGIVRYNSDGSLDLSFNQNGRLVIPIGATSATGMSAKVQADNKIVLSGFSSQAGGQFAMVRIHPNGDLDSTFGIHGIAVSDFEYSDHKAVCMDIQNDYRILLAGYFSDTYNKTAVARYLSGLNVGVMDFSVNTINNFIYPNPVVNEAILEYELQKSESISISLLDMNGKTMQTFINNQLRDKGKHSETLHFNNHLPTGYYWLHIKTPISQATVKIVKE